MLRKIIHILIFISLPYAMFAQEVSKRDTLVRKKFIQILSSYTYEDEWDTSIAKSICSKVEKTHPEISLIVSYAGIGNRSSFLSERFAMQGAFSTGRLSATVAVPDVLVLIGDESWMFYRVMDLRGLWEKVPVVLCGMSAEIMKDYSRFFPDRVIPDSLMIPLQESLKDLPVTGVMQKNSSLPTLNMMKQLIPGLNEVVYLSNRSYQDLLAEKELQATLPSCPDLAVRTVYVNSNNTDSIQQLVNHLPSTTAVLVNMHPALASCPVPIFSLRDSESIKKTFVGGYTTSIDKISTSAAQLILRVYEGESPLSIPFVHVDEFPHLNKVSVLHFGMMSNAKKVSGVVYRNIPPPFILRHIRVIAFLTLAAIILFFSVLIYFRSRANSRRLKSSLDTLKQLYDKYQTVYKNMPIGLLSLDREGRQIQHNEGAEVLLSQFPAYSKGDFNLFRSGVLTPEEMQKVRMGIPVTTMRWMGKSCFRFIIRPIAHTDTGESNILMIVADNTDIELARIEKDKIYEMLNFAMNASSLGIAEYNLLDGKGFATQAWYDNMGIEPGNDEFAKAQAALLPEYKERIDSCLEQIKAGEKRLFLEVVEVQSPSGEKHWLRYLIQLMEYAPENGRIVIAELVYNIDGQVIREKELTTALWKALEADRLKNSFIANMRDEIRIPLNEIIHNATLLTKEKDPGEMWKLYEHIEINNQMLLTLINQLIDVSIENEE